MKWPLSITMMRHAVSEYNNLKRQWAGDPDYERFVELYETDFINPETLRLAKVIKGRYALPYGDWNTPATEEGLEDAYVTGLRLAETMELPSVVFTSPYVRTKQTYEAVVRGWPALRGVRVVHDARLREQKHGLATLYNNWRVFHAFHPEQRELYEKEGPYYYEYPQGEDVPSVQDRVRNMFGTWIRDYSAERVFVVSHHLTILTVVTTIERTGEDEFMRLDKEDKPLNCGLTRYECDPTQGRDGKLIRAYYNRKLY